MTDECSDIMINKSSVEINDLSILVYEIGVVVLHLKTWSWR